MYYLKSVMMHLVKVVLHMFGAEVPRVGRKHVRLKLQFRWSQFFPKLSIPGCRCCRLVLSGSGPPTPPGCLASSCLRTHADTCLIVRMPYARMRRRLNRRGVRNGIRKITPKSLALNKPQNHPQFGSKFFHFWIVLEVMEGQTMGGYFLDSNAQSKVHRAPEEVL